MQTAIANKTFKLSQGNRTGTFYTSFDYTVKGDTVKVQQYIWDSWGIIPNGWKKPVVLTLEAARADYRDKIRQGYQR